MQEKNDWEISLGKEILELPEGKLYGIKNCQNRIIALTKDEVIPVAKVKEKIGKLDKEEKQQLKGTKGQDRYAIKQEFMYKRNILQELLEGK